MKDELTRDVEDKDGTETADAGITVSPTITLDYERYQAYLDEADLTEDQKRDVLDALWSIIVSFVDLGFGVHPVQQACGQLPKIGASAPKDGHDGVNCDDHLNQEFKSVSAQQCCSKARE